jgi:protein involved in ribonucleotide reduction
MKIVYMSLTGKVREFVSRLGLESIELSPQTPPFTINEQYIIITPTYDHEITEIVDEFIEYGNNKNNLLGVMGSGNLVFDGDYIFTAKNISAKFSIPLLYGFEFNGTDIDVVKAKEAINGVAKITDKKQ